MQHIKPQNIKHCIVLSCTEFNHICDAVLSSNTEIIYELTGISIETPDHLSESDILTHISDYFQVPITSIHIDDEEPFQVWLTFTQE